MIYREIEKPVKCLLQKYPIINITGPRQSGKTTLAKSLGDSYRHFPMDDPDIRRLAKSDPLGFLNSAGEKFILDEVQYVPQLFPYLPQVLDSNSENGRVILLTSQHFEMDEKTTQSLAGKIASLRLLPLSYSELKLANKNSLDINNMLFTGSYPRLIQENMHPTDFFPHYIERYLQGEVRQIKNIDYLDTFAQFTRLCAGRVGNVINYSILANAANISVNTARTWVSLLEASYIVYFVPAHSGSIDRRLIRTSKLYFYDTGLLCSLLGIENRNKVEASHLRGGLFENMVFSELVKSRYNKGLPADFQFLRDSRGSEIDCLIEKDDKHIMIEIKPIVTLSSIHRKNILTFRSEFPKTADYIIYSGRNEASYNNIKYCNWKNIEGIEL